jgi:hypothetical protein
MFLVISYRNALTEVFGLDVASTRIGSYRSFPCVTPIWADPHHINRRIG